MKNISPLIFVSALFASLYGLGWLPDETPFYQMLAKGAGVTLLAVYAAHQRNMFLAAALGFGALGDVFLAAPLANNFIYGLSAFLVGHLFYIAIFWPWRSGFFINVLRRRMALVTVLLMIMMGWHLVPLLGDKLIPVLVYMGVLGAMTLLAQFNHLSMLAAVGAFLFFTSDVILGMNLFSDTYDVPRWVNWWVYYPAQLLLCLGLVKNGAHDEN